MFLNRHCRSKYLVGLGSIWQYHDLQNFRFTLSLFFVDFFSFDTEIVFAHSADINVIALDSPDHRQLRLVEKC